MADEGKKRVVIVDTSNEIGGDGDVPHSGIGRSRRMQVPKVTMQHNVGSQYPFIYGSYVVAESCKASFSNILY